MAKLTVTARGQVTLKKDVLAHLGVEPGDQINYEKLPGGAIRIQVSQPKGSIQEFIGLLEGSTTKALSVEEIKEVSAAAWAGES